MLYLNRHVTIQLRIPRPVHLTHAARTERFEDFAMTECADDGRLVRSGEYELSVVVCSRSRCPQPLSLSPPLLEAMLPGVIRDGARLLLAL